MPYFYSNSDRVAAANRMKVDFLVSKSLTKPQHNVYLPLYMTYLLSRRK